MVEHRLVDRARKHKPIRETEVTYNRKHSHQRRRESAEYGSSDIGDVDLDLERLAGLWLEHAEVAGESDQSGLLVVELEFDALDLPRILAAALDVILDGDLGERCGLRGGQCREI